MVIVHYQLFCGVQIGPLYPLSNYKIVRLFARNFPNTSILILQLILVAHWKPYLEYIQRKYANESKAIMTWTIYGEENVTK